MDRTKAIDILRVIAPPRTSKKVFYDFMEARDMAIAALEQAPPTITHEQAINYLRETGWLQNHDRILTESKIAHGHWIRDFSNYYCSECKEFAHIDYNKWDVFSPGVWRLSNFCPNCGADMRGE